MCEISPGEVTSMGQRNDFSHVQVLDLAKQFPTPFHLYHEETIRKTVRGLNEAFSWCPGYKNHFAVKATPNPHIMQVLKEEGRRICT